MIPAIQCMTGEMRSQPVEIDPEEDRLGEEREALERERHPDDPTRKAMNRGHKRPSSNESTVRRRRRREEDRRCRGQRRRDRERLYRRSGVRPSATAISMGMPMPTAAKTNVKRERHRHLRAGERKTSITPTCPAPFTRRPASRRLHFVQSDGSGDPAKLLGAVSRGEAAPVAAREAPPARAVQVRRRPEPPLRSLEVETALRLRVTHAAVERTVIVPLVAEDFWAWRTVSFGMPHCRS